MGKSILYNTVAQFGKPKGAKVGSISYVFTTTAKPPQVLAELMVKLPPGTLRLQKTLASSEPQNITFLPVVGGSGAFAGARGTMDARYLAPHGVQHIYRLRLP